MSSLSTHKFERAKTQIFPFQFGSADHSQFLVVVVALRPCACAPSLRKHSILSSFRSNAWASTSTWGQPGCNESRPRCVGNTSSISNSQHSAIPWQNGVWRVPYHVCRWWPMWAWEICTAWEETLWDFAQRNEQKPGSPRMRSDWSRCGHVQLCYWNRWFRPRWCFWRSRQSIARHV